MKKSIVTTTVFVTALIITGCSSSSSTSASTAPSKTGYKVTAAKPAAADAGAQLACEHFRNVMSDAAAGVLTDTELRTKLKEVYGDAQGSSNAGITDGAQAVLAADTSGDSKALIKAGTVFQAACLKAERPTPAITHAADVGAKLTCKDFRKFVIDVSAGTLKKAQLFDAMKKIGDDSMSSTDTGINDGAFAISMLDTKSGATAADAAVKKLSTACTALGF